MTRRTGQMVGKKYQLSNRYQNSTGSPKKDQAGTKMIQVWTAATVSATVGQTGIKMILVISNRYRFDTATGIVLESNRYRFDTRSY